VTGSSILAVIAVLSLVFFVFATVELAALARGVRAVPSALRRLVPEALEAAGIARVLGTVCYGGVAIGTQIMALYLLLGRPTELSAADRIVLGVELGAAISWTAFLLRRSSVRSEPGGR